MARAEGTSARATRGFAPDPTRAPPLDPARGLPLEPLLLDFILCPQTLTAAYETAPCWCGRSA